MAPHDAHTARGGVPAWVVRTSLTLAMTGLAVSTYLGYEHLTRSATLACPESGRVDCVKVTTSTYADVHGVPVAYLGIVYFAAMAVLTMPRAWRASQPVTTLRIVATAGGLAAALALVWVELFRLDAICLWCTGVHVVTFALFAVILLGEALREDDQGRIDDMTEVG